MSNSKVEAIKIVIEVDDKVAIYENFMRNRVRNFVEFHITISLLLYKIS